MLWGPLFTSLPFCGGQGGRRSVRLEGLLQEKRKGWVLHCWGGFSALRAPQFILNRSAKVLVGCNSQREAEERRERHTSAIPGSSEEEQRGH